MSTINNNRSAPSWLSDEALQKITVPETGSIINGKIVHRTKNELWVKLDDRTLGVIPPKEMKDGLGTAKDLKPGDEVAAYVVSPENADGYMVLSLKRAARDTVWEILAKKKEKGDVIEISPVKANRGGLIAVLHNIQGFLPVSQLSLENYPRVKDGNKEEILAKLKRLCKTPMKVKVLDVDRKERKLIFSEKAAYSQDMDQFIKKLAVGDIVQGVVSGVVNFGVFVTLDKGVEGLIHISEIAWEHVKDASDYFKEGQKVKAKVIDISDGKISLSTRQLKEDPWKAHTKGVEMGSIVKGKVMRVVPFGALVKVRDYVDALAHISELSETPIDKPSQVIEVNQTYNFKVIEFDPDEHRMGLSLKGVKDAPKPSPVSDEDKVESEAENKKEGKAEKVEEKPVKKENSKKSAKEEGIESLEISEKLTNALKEAGFDTLEKIKSASDSDLTAVTGVGPKTVDAIRAKL